MHFEPATMETAALYHLLTRIVAPRPIAFVSTRSGDGELNLAPFSYFSLGGLQPPSAVFCPVNDRKGRMKDTLRNIEETKEYVINVVTREMAEAMNETSANFPHDVNEFEVAGFTPEASTRVRPPRVAESPISMEMELFEIVTHGPGPLAGNYIIGEIHLVRIREEWLGKDGLPDPDAIRLIGRMGGDYYVDAIPSALFELERPKGP